MAEYRRCIDVVLFPDQSSADGRWSRTIWALTINFLSFVALAAVAFEFNKVYLYYGLDGTYMQNIAKQQLEWNQPMLGFTNNFLQSLGNVWFPLNTLLIPGYSFPEFLSSGELVPAVSYLVFSAELFLATFLLGLSLRLGPAVSALAAWLLCVGIMPFFAPPRVYAVMSLVPHMATAIAATLLVLILFGQIGRHGWAVSSICLCGAGLLLGHTIVALPDKLVLMVPVLSIFGLCSLATARARSEVFAKLGGASSLLGAIIMSGAAAFVLGMFKYTAAVYFSKEFLNDRMTLIFVSILFHHRRPYGGPILFALGVIGALVVAWRGSGPARSFSGGTLVAVALVFGLGLTTVHFDFWQGPSPLYFEFFLWPFYAIYGAVTLVILFRLCADWLCARSSWCSKLSLKKSMFADSATLIALFPWLIVLSAQSYRHAGESKSQWLYPPPRTPIVTALQQEIGVIRGSLFRGRVATFTGLSINRPVTWLDLHNNDYALMKEFDNDHRMVGLWYYDIPTLAENNNLITPPYYLVTRALLARPGDRQLRSVMTLRAIEPRILRMMGVRFLITDAPVDDGVRLRLRIPGRGNAALFLYELSGVNLGDYSPTETVRVENARSLMNILTDSSFDPMHTVLVDTPLPGRFVPATASRLFVEGGGLRLSARSEGTSVLLLPVEYSHCLEIQSTENAVPLPRLFRANLLQTGVRFNRSIEANLTYFTGPFHNSTCRIEDARDMERLRIAEEVERK